MVEAFLTGSVDGGEAGLWEQKYSSRQKIVLKLSLNTGQRRVDVPTVTFKEAEQTSSSRGTFFIPFLIWGAEMNKAFQNREAEKESWE